MRHRYILIATAVLIICAGVLFGARQLLTPRDKAIADMMPPGALFYLETPDFHSLLADWNGSPEKQEWLASDNYAVFSRSRLFGRLSQAQTEFATAAGIPPDMQFVEQIAGKESAFAWYDIGKLEFLYITRMPSGAFTQSTLWQSRARFDVRRSGNFEFYLRTDLESQRTVCFATTQDLLVLGTREDLVADALSLIGGAQGRSLSDEPWYAAPVSQAKARGDLRMVLNLEKLVPSPYFRSYWIQQNVTDLKQYRTAISDLYRTQQVYREKRVLLRKNVTQAVTAPADISPLVASVPSGVGFYQAISDPSSGMVLETLKDKLLDPRPHPDAAYTFAPAAPEIDQAAGQAADLETHIDKAPFETKRTDPWQPLQSILETAQVNGLLICESSDSEKVATFTKFHSAVVISAAHDWDSAQVKSILSSALETQITTLQLGLGWIDRDSYSELDGLSPLSLSTQGKYLILSDDPVLLLAIRDSVDKKNAAAEAAVYASGFDHGKEAANFRRISTFLDRAGMRGGSAALSDPNGPRQPAFFSGNMASFSQVFKSVVSESMVVHDSGDKVTQMVTYQWQ